MNLDHWRRSNHGGANLGNGANSHEPILASANCKGLSHNSLGGANKHTHTHHETHNNCIYSVHGVEGKVKVTKCVRSKIIVSECVEGRIIVRECGK